MLHLEALESSDSEPARVYVLLRDFSVHPMAEYSTIRVPCWLASIWWFGHNRSATHGGVKISVGPDARQSLSDPAFLPQSEISLVAFCSVLFLGLGYGSLYHDS